MTLVTVKEFAEMHNVSPQAVRYRIKQGHIKVQGKYGLQLINPNIKFKVRAK